MRRIKLSSVTYDPHYYPRVNGKPDWMIVLRYKGFVEADPSKADPKNNPDAFPPIVVVLLPGGKFLLLDGLHRLKAFVNAGLTHIYAIVEKLPKSKWLARAAELNIPESRGLDDSDKAWVGKRLLAEGYSKKQVATLLTIKIERLEKIFVERCHKMKAGEARKIVCGGRSHRKINGDHIGFVKAPFRHLTNTSKAVDGLVRQGKLNSRTILDVLDGAIAIFEAGAIDMGNDEVAAAVVRLAKLVEPLAAIESKS